MPVQTALAKADWCAAVITLQRGDVQGLRTTTTDTAQGRKS